jgi:hypothetical protein
MAPANEAIRAKMLEKAKHLPAGKWEELEEEEKKMRAVMESDPAMKAYYEILLVKALSNDVASAKMSREFEEWRVEKEKKEKEEIALVGALKEKREKEGEKIEREVKKTGVAEAAPMPGMLSSTSLPLRQVQRLTLK